MRKYSGLLRSAGAAPTPRRSRTRRRWPFCRYVRPKADACIVGDLDEGLEGGFGRSTRKRPQLRFFLDSIERLSFQLDFIIAEATFRHTGPVTITIFINENLLDKNPVPGAGFIR